MTTEELLKPRYKVIADYPNSCCRVGYIITEPVPIIYLQAYSNANADYTLLDKFPHLFKNLNWYEERNIEDMPMFLKHTGTGEIWKVDKYDCKRPVINGTINKVITISESLPATEAEYNEFVLAACIAGSGNKNSNDK